MILPVNGTDAVALLPGIIYCDKDQYRYVLSVMAKGSFMRNEEGHSLPILYYSKAMNKLVDLDQAFFTQYMSSRHNFYSTIENMMKGFTRIARIALRLRRMYYSTHQILKANTAEEFLMNKHIIPDLNPHLLSKVKRVFAFKTDDLIELSEFREILGYAYTTFMWTTRCYLLFILRKAYKKKMKPGFKKSMESGNFAWFDVPFFECVIYNLERMETLGYETIAGPLQIVISHITDAEVSDKAKDRDIEDLVSAFCEKYIGNASEL